MALELEKNIMKEIGLGTHYSWYNGSGSCISRRQRAAAMLPTIIQGHRNAGDGIAQPDEELAELLKEVAEYGDENMYSLTRTWQAASDIIAHHIHMASATDVEKEKVYGNLKQYIRENYLPKLPPRRPNSFYG